MGTDAYSEFARLLRQLEDWYADSVRAITYDAAPGTHETGHAVLLRKRYPGPDWRAEWAHAANNPIMQAAILRSLEDELYGLTHGPSQAGPASGLHRGTSEWRLAVGQADGSLRTVARRFGISHTEVRRLRLQHREAQAP